MDALGKLDEIETMVHSGRGVGGRRLLDVAPVIAELGVARRLVAEELVNSRAVLAERDALRAEGGEGEALRAEIERLRSEVERLGVEVARSGTEAERLRAELAAEQVARIPEAEVSAESKQILEEASVFAERSLAELEAVLQRVLYSITRARTALDSDGSVLGARGLRRALEPAEKAEVGASPG